jgi:hypothetical protein
LHTDDEHHDRRDDYKHVDYDSRPDHNNGPR